jgi:hypothetical protein
MMPAHGKEGRHQAGERTLDPFPDVLRPAVEHRGLTSNQGPNDTEFCGQDNLAAPPRDRLADEFLAAGVDAALDAVAKVPEQAS